MSTIYIGRFQPFHLGHLAVAKEVLKHDNLIFVIGSSGQGPSLKNPFNTEFRYNSLYTHELNDQNYEFYHTLACDVPENNQIWAENVLKYANFESKRFWDEPVTSIVGFKKDASSFYLDLFPSLKFVEAQNYKDINATDIRNMFFSGVAIEDLLDLVPLSTALELFRYKYEKQDLFNKFFKELLKATEG